MLYIWKLDQSYCMICFCCLDNHVVISQIFTSLSRTVVLIPIKSDVVLKILKAAVKVLKLALNLFLFLFIEFIHGATFYFFKKIVCQIE